MKKYIKLYSQDGQLLGFQEYGGAPTTPYSTTPAFPITTTSGGTFVVTKIDGSNFTDAEVQGLKFTINGNVVDATPGSSIDWLDGATVILYVTRTTWGSSVEVHMTAAGYTVSAIE